MDRATTFPANDGTRLSYTKYGPEQSCHPIILLHGFTGSGQYFDRNRAALAQFGLVIPDLRGHGRSKAECGFHVARLAADLRDLLMHLRVRMPETKPVVVGCSLGAAVVWTYCELYGSSDWSKLVFVDQAPLQNRSFDGRWTLGSFGCYDAQTLAREQALMIDDQRSWAEGLVASCLAYRHAPKDVVEGSGSDFERDTAFFVDITCRTDPLAMAELMADHTQIDHRKELPRCITCPVLVVAGSRSGCFPVAGTLETAALINATHPGLARTMVMDSGHWPFYEHPLEFDRMLIDFVKGGLET